MNRLFNTELNHVQTIVCPTVYLCTSIWVCPRAEKIKASLGRIRATKGSLILESFSLGLKSSKKKGAK